jgi:hypothetical protein
MNSNYYIIKTKTKGVKLVTIKGLTPLQFSEQHLLDAKESTIYVN